MAPLIEFRDVYKIYHMGDSEVRAADGISMKINKGEFVAIVGQSGSGKSTCMNIIGCLDVPTAGQYFLGGHDVSRLDDDDLADIRNRMLGFIFQQYNLLSKLNLLENVEVSLMYAGMPRHERVARAREVLDRVGLGDKVRHKPSQLSGGQQQRVSIGRALINNPAIVLADEPTGNLDSKNSAEIIALLKMFHKAYNQTLLIITHDERIALQADRVISIEDGHIAKDEVRGR